MASNSSRTNPVGKYNVIHLPMYDFQLIFRTIGENIEKLFLKKCGDPINL